MRHREAQHLLGRVYERHRAISEGLGGWVGVVDGDFT